MTPIKGYLDHVVVLIPYDMLINPPAWITDNFTLSPGGRHAGNETENKLVLFQDGTYLEFIAFINDDPQKRKGHWWDKPYGVVDFALTTKPDEPLDHEALEKRMADLHTPIRYGAPQTGGRATGGKEIKWQVTFPEGTERGTLPFWCEDITPREWRVPLTDENTTHPCGALGMAGLGIYTKGNRSSRLAKAAKAVVGLENEVETHYERMIVKLRAPNEVHDLHDPDLTFGAIGEHGLDKSLEGGGHGVGLPGSMSSGEIETQDLEMRLSLQCVNERKGICERIGDGKVWIMFEGLFTGQTDLEVRHREDLEPGL
ncbi:glyoxalase-like domain-containing protein [Xylariaceae sp. FL1272]|nr:glyoxalase-like domain-containing protein [Xylariaceae sp. FL1272]